MQIGTDATEARLRIYDCQFGGLTAVIARDLTVFLGLVSGLEIQSNAGCEVQEPKAGLQKSRTIRESMAQGVTVIHLGRCGSTVLGDLLDQHSQISWFGEILEPLMQAARKLQGVDYVLNGDPATLSCETLAHCQTSYGGLEFKPFHFSAYCISQATFISRMREAGFRKFVVLDRRNRLRKIVSSRWAADSGVWHIPAQAKGETRQLTLNVESLHMDRFSGTLIQFLEMYDAQFRELRELVSPDFLDLVYEDDIEADPIVAYKRVIDYLDLPFEPASVRLGRTASGPLQAELKNFETVAQYLAGTRYAWMLEG